MFWSCGYVIYYRNLTVFRGVHSKWQDVLVKKQYRWFGIHSAAINPRYLHNSTRMKRRTLESWALESFFVLWYSIQKSHVKCRNCPKNWTMHRRRPRRIPEPRRNYSVERMRQYIYKWEDDVPHCQGRDTYDQLYVRLRTPPSGLHCAEEWFILMYDRNIRQAKARRYVRWGSWFVPMNDNDNDIGNSFQSPLSWTLFLMNTSRRPAREGETCSSHWPADVELAYWQLSCTYIYHSIILD